jgi:Domain of unknown function (DUF4145)
MTTIGRTLEDLARCPQCGVASPLLVIKGGFADVERTDQAKMWFFYQCTRCSDLVAVTGTVNRSLTAQYSPEQIVTSWPPTLERMMPEASAINEYVPSRARVYMEQALAAREAPDGVVMLAGSAVDAMLKEKGYQDGSLYERIDSAVKDHLLTPGMGEWAHLVRLGSNGPRHADLQAPHATREEADSALSLTEALANFLFVIPAQIERGKQAAGGTA